MTKCLCHHVDFEELLDITYKMRFRFPRISFGINGLGQSPKTLLKKEIDFINAIWFDQTITSDILEDRIFTGEIFGGLAPITRFF